jgi:PPOX class probable F420-dependent enzyme
MSEPTALRVQRTFNAPARDVFDALVNPEVMRRWWHPGEDWETPHAEADPRPGGRFRVVMRRPDGEEYAGSGEYTVFDPPRRLTFSWSWDDEQVLGQPSQVDITLTERDGVTEVVLTHEGLADAESAEGHAEGWEVTLDNLARKALMSQLPDEVRVLFDGANVAHVATLMPDGSPHSVPLWVGVEAGRIAFLTGPGARKAHNLERDPRVSISVTASDQPTTMAQVRGSVRERLEGDAAREVIDRISHKYVGQPYPREEDRVVFLVEPERAWAQAYV